MQMLILNAIAAKVITIPFYIPIFDLSCYINILGSILRPESLRSLSKYLQLILPARNS